MPETRMFEAFDMSSRLRAIAAGRDQRTLGLSTPGSLTGPETAKAAE